MNPMVQSSIISSAARLEMYSDDSLMEKVLALLDGMGSILGEMNKAGSKAAHFKKLAETAKNIAALVESRDPHKAGHQLRVADLAEAIGSEMNLAAEQTDGLYLAGLLHDIGKIHIPAGILNSPVKLTEDEHNIVKTHVKAGFDLLEKLAFPWPLKRIVLEHHEKWDGSGYPNGLKGDEMLLEARILAVADVVDAFATTRSYRPALEVEAALFFISGNRNILYDSDVVNACLRLFNEKGYKMLETD